MFFFETTTKSYGQFLIFATLLSVFLSGAAFDFKDCYYNETENHVEYICEGNTGANFNRRTSQYLYCNNFYSSGIDRNEIHQLSYRNCEENNFVANFFDSFRQLTVLNISFIKLEVIKAADLKTSKYLEVLAVAHNSVSKLPADLFIYSSELLRVNFSNNHIGRLDPFLFENTRKLTTIDFSSNLIEALDKRIFSNLQFLEFLDFNNNRIKRIEDDLLKHNRNLRIFHICNNQVDQFECTFLTSLMMESRSLAITINTLEKLDSCMKKDANINLVIDISSNELKSHLKVSNKNFTWSFCKSDFVKMRSLQLFGVHSENISTIVQEASEKLETLDISHHFVGKLNASTFERFINLEKLNLSQTNLTNFDFSTFFHQRNLKMLDISFNNLRQIDFHFFVRNFQKLVSLNLEGNNLTEINSVTRSHFPVLSILSISKNNFTCDYVVNFLLQWPNLELIHNPSNQIHVGGVDCIHLEKHNNQLQPYNGNDPRNNGNQSNFNHSDKHLEDLSMIRNLLIFIGFALFIIGLSLVIICSIQIIKKFKLSEKFTNDSENQAVVYHSKNDTSSLL